MRERPLRGGRLRVPPGGVDDVETLGIVRSMVARLHVSMAGGAWLIVANAEVVGLCSYRRPPSDGTVEIGYGVAAARRGRGHATRAVAAMASLAASSGVAVLIAASAVHNPASGRVLEKNGFVVIGTRVDDDDGEVLVWRREAPFARSA